MFTDTEQFPFGTPLEGGKVMILVITQKEFSKDQKNMTQGSQVGHIRGASSNNERDPVC